MPRGIPNSRVANVAPAKTFEAAEQPVGQDNPRDMPVTGDAMLSDAVIEPVYGPDWKTKAEALAFMEESVDVMVHPSTDRNAEPIVELWCNGRSQFFARNQLQTVKRKFVEVLARARTTAYTQERYRDGNGNDAIRNIPHTALRYPFSVMHDPNPRGRAWLQKVLAEA